MPIRLIATDIDGTLLDSENRLPPVNVQVLQQAVAGGVHIALVTARKVNTTRRIAALLDLPCALIAHNGARIWDWAGHELRHLTVALELAQAIAGFADVHDIPLMTTVDEVNYYGPGYPLKLEGQSRDDQRVPTNIAAVMGAPTRIIVVGARGIELLAEAWGQAADSLVIHRYYSREGAMYSAVLTHARANKADALNELCGKTGIAASEVLALGDAEADAPMLRWAGIGVAMGNAMAEARAAADWVAPDHDAGGFAAAVERFVLR